MAMVIGDISASAGLAKRIYDNYIANSTACGFGASPSNAAKDMLRAQAYCVAKAVVDEIAANAAVATTTTITSSHVGLQRVPTPNTSGTNTDGPSVDRILNGTGTIT